MAKRRKILFLNHVPAVSGAEASLLDTLGALDSGAWECLAVIPEPGPLYVGLARLGIRTVFMPLRRLKKTWNPFVLASCLFNVVAVARDLAGLIRSEGIDLVHANSNTAQIYGGLAAAWAGVPCVWHSRDLVELGPLGRWMCGKASRIVAISDAVKRHLGRYGSGGKVVTIRNGIDTAPFESVRKRYGKVAGVKSFMIGMAGQMTPWKNHALFIQAAARIAAEVPDALFMVFGGDLFGGDGRYEADMKKLAKECGLANKLVFAGQQADNLGSLASLDILIHPAEKEPLGRVILEAMALGKPVIAVDACGPAEIITPGVDGFLVPPGDYEAMARNAIALWKDPWLAARVGIQARLTIRREFGIVQQAARISRVYGEVLAATGRRKVAYVVAEFPSISETFILREMTALERQGVEIVLFALKRPSSSRTHPEAVPFRSRVHYRMGAARTLAAALPALARSPFRSLRLLGRMAWRGDPEERSRLKGLWNLATAAAFARAARREGVAHVHAHFAYVTADIGLLVARILGVPYSLSAHAWDIYTRKKEALAERVNAAAFTAVCTGHGRKRLKALFPDLPDARLILSRHGIFLDRYPAAKPAEPLILGVGRLEPKKGFRHLVEACRILKEKRTAFRCMIVGGGSQRESLAGQIRDGGLASDVLLAGELSQDQLMELYARATILACPSVEGPDGDLDGLPNVLIEAMAARIPVVASTLSAIPEAVGDGFQGFLVPPGDAARLAERLEILLGDEALRRRMGEKGRETVERDFDISRNVKQLAGLFGGTAGE